MNNKTKSLLYFICFVFSAFTYHALEDNTTITKSYTETKETKVEKISDDKLNPESTKESVALN
ncbi:hypothetical protein [uncultured Eudoraea sp.]|uniref:hypothetical protein n=1 Tax=uncultured Eudoraea sp. TaxID=1035614 RepID=UPI0026255FF9|nr:hypothetical protein [uncultured Eudoraea sp.]